MFDWFKRSHSVQVESIYGDTSNLLQIQKPGVQKAFCAAVQIISSSQTMSSPQAKAAPEPISLILNTQTHFNKFDDVTQ